jgi:general secretion pathway protein J
MTGRSPRARGFTLIELVVALFISAIMFVLGYRALSQAISSRRELEEQAAKLQALQRAMRIIEQDLELVEPRPVRNTIGDGWLGAVVAANSGATGSISTQLSGSALNGSSPPIVTFTRVGWTNPVGVQRSELQRVFYSLENGNLVRSYYPVLDATEAVLPVQRTLIEHVKSFSLRFMDAGYNWQTTWPEDTLGGTSPLTQLRTRPIAVEINIEIEGWGVLKRHIEVPG